MTTKTQTGHTIIASASQAIADALSVGRTRLKPTSAGVGTILSVLGLSVGNALRDLPRCAIYHADGSLWSPT